MSETPTPSDIMAAYALDAVDHARDKFGVILDFTPQSVEKVEGILGKMCDARPKGLLGKLLKRGPPDESVDQFAKMYGAYIGEVLRRRAGSGEWYMDEKLVPGAIVYGMTLGGGKFWPHIKVHKRFVNGPEDNVWVYYCYLESQYCPDSDYRVNTVTEIKSCPKVAGESGDEKPSHPAD